MVAELAMASRESNHSLQLRVSVITPSFA